VAVAGHSSGTSSAPAPQGRGLRPGSSSDVFTTVDVVGDRGVGGSTVSGRGVGGSS
ncbi:unnamed protein product, partial [Amoebophrya sp. A25]